MNVRQVVVLGVVLAVGTGLIAGTAVGLSATQESSEGMGVQVSSFAQATAADANSSVDAGMWEAELNQSSNPNATVEERIDELQKRLSKLRNRSAEVDGNGTLGTARASAIRAEIVALKSTINDTADTATQYGVNETKLDRLRTEASNLTGPEVAAIARNITDAPRGPPEDVPGNGSGPPDDAGPGNETGPPDDAGPGNETGPPENGGPGNETGPPENGGSGNETGPPENGGPGNGSGPPDDGGPGNGSGPPDDGGPGNGSGPPENGGPGNGSNTTDRSGTESTTATSERVTDGELRAETRTPVQADAVWGRFAQADRMPG